MPVLIMKFHLKTQIYLLAMLHYQLALDMVVCPNESGPIFALELASLMELNYGQESQTRRDYSEVTSS